MTTHHTVTASTATAVTSDSRRSFLKTTALATGGLIMGFALLGYHTTRTNQMTRQYPWLYEKTGPLSWRQKSN